MSRHVSHLTLSHPTRVDERDVETISGHFRQLALGDALVRTSTAFEGERVYRVASITRERVTCRNDAARTVDIEFVIAEEVPPGEK